VCEKVGQVLLVAGAGFSNATQAWLCADAACATTRVPVAVLEAWAESVKVEVPVACAAPPCLLQLCDQGACAAPLYVNRPDVWWYA
jgi:hypothetical protein